jgi:hypothetical protein
MPSESTRRSTLPGPIEVFLSEDHVRLDHLLREAEAAMPADLRPYEAFREGLLRHIGMEEKVLLPYARSRRGGAPLPLAGALRVDHGAIARLLTRTPTPAILEELRALLATHNALEEGETGLYATCDALAGDEGAVVVARLRAQPQVPLARYYDGPPHGDVPS